MIRNANIQNGVPAANAAADEALDALDLARESLDWLGTLAQTIADQAPEHSPIRNLAAIAINVADSAIENARSTHERLREDADVSRMAIKAAA